MAAAKGKGQPGITKREDHTWNHGAEKAPPMEHHVKILVEQLGYSLERAKAITKSQAQLVIHNYFDREHRKRRAKVK